MVELEILTSNGNPVTKYYHEGNTYIEGRKGNNYSLRLINRNHRKVLAILSIDGLSILSGEPASYESSGYVLSPYQTLTIDGWRTDLQHVRKFVFSDAKSSYSKKSGNGEQNLGVIGLACFFEKDKYIRNINSSLRGSSFSDTKYIADCFDLSSSQTFDWMESMNTTETLSAKACSDAVLKNSSLGTGMGNKIYSECKEAYFNKADVPFQTTVINYRSREVLKRMGIVIHTNYKDQSPNPFPAETRFCKEV